ncbi:helix-turn-helix transcriptional regulator [Pseudoalteromonas lipolytica]
MKLYDGEILKNARKKLSLTQDEVSEVLGISRKQISQMENSKFDGGLKYFLKYLSLLNLEICIIPRHND